jgi:hypothetical protein
MLAVVLDSNAIHSDPWLTGAPGTTLLRLAEGKSCFVVIPEVVRDELRRQRRKSAQESHTQAAKGVRAMAKAGVDVDETDAHLNKSFQRIDADIDAAFTALFNREGVAVEPTPYIDVAKIVERDLDRRRPFQEITHNQKTKSLGFRDVVIWETVLSVLDPARGNGKVLFVSADKGFLSEDSKSLHPDLLGDLDDRGIDRARLVSIKNVLHATTAIKATATQAAQVTAATDALYELVGQEVSEQLVYGGDYGYPDFVDFTVPEIEGAYISGIDQTSGFDISEGETLIATAEANVYLEGAVFKGDWYVDQGGSIELGGEINKHYFDASSEVPVRVVVEIEMNGEKPEVTSILLKDPADHTGVLQR